jgi:hypothetical protein
LIDLVAKITTFCAKVLTLREGNNFDRRNSMNIAKFVLVGAITLISSIAQSHQSYQQIGNQRFYSNGTSAQQNGNQTFHSNGKSCQ